MQNYSSFFDDEEEQAMLVAMMSNNESVSQIALEYLNEDSVRQGRGGSVNGRRVLPVNCTILHELLISNYFADIFDADTQPRFDATTFRRRYRMQRDLFIKISSDLEHHDRYFRQLPDGESIGLASSTAMECMKRFCKGIREMYGEQYLRTPTKEELAKIMAINEQRGFPGMIGSIDCMHWVWKNCPTAWAGVYTGKEKKPTLILEAVATQDLWIWHSYFGLPGSLNDINVLDRSPVFDAQVSGKIPETPFTVNRRVYNKPYYLGDGIYPDYATIVKALKITTNASEKHFDTKQEAVRKDVERCFGVLQLRFGIIRQPANMWNQEDLRSVMTACIILHNMIIEDERDEDLPVDYDVGIDGSASNNVDLVQNESDSSVIRQYSGYLDRFFAIRDTNVNLQLQQDLIQHNWDMEGNKSLA